MALLSKTTIFIDGNEVPAFKHLYLNQQIAAHHTLEIVFRKDIFEDDTTELGEKSKEFLGKRIAVQIGPISDNSDMGILEFTGIVTEIKITKGGNTGGGDEIIISAKSLTILFDEGPHCDSYNESSLEDIISLCLQPYPINYTISTQYIEVIDYCVQQNESTFAFIRRLAAQCGEWFYYNGQELVFGHPEFEETALKYTIDLHAYDLSLRPCSQNHAYYTNDYIADEIHVNNEQSKPHDISAISGFVFDKSKEMYSHPTLAWNNNNNSPFAKNQLEAKVKAQHECTVINEVILNGSSSNPGVKLGNIIKIKDEKYRVIKVVHSTDQSGHYQNNFTAITGSFNAYPFTNINAFPKSESQIGVVTDNYDPEAMGRIKVQFPWQIAKNKTTPWIRMMSPHAGSGKGFYCIPEIGEEVLIDFEGNNAEAPYAAGCFYNANAKPPSNCSGASNAIKIFQTRSGCSLTFNDGDGSIKLKDKEGSMIHMYGNGDVLISAMENLNTDCKVAAFDGRESVNVGSPSTTIAGDQSLWLTSDLELKAEGATAIVEATSGKVEVKGLLAEVNASSVKVNGTVSTEIKGGQVKLN